MSTEKSEPKRYDTTGEIIPGTVLEDDTKENPNDTKVSSTIGGKRRRTKRGKTSRRYKKRRGGSVAHKVSGGKSRKGSRRR